jgi:hypothetical protein
MLSNNNLRDIRRCREAQWDPKTGRNSRSESDPANTTASDITKARGRSVPRFLNEAPRLVVCLDSCNSKSALRNGPRLSKPRARQGASNSAWSTYKEHAACHRTIGPAAALVYLQVLQPVVSTVCARVESWRRVSGHVVRNVPQGKSGGEGKPWAHRRLPRERVWGNAHPKPSGDALLSREVTLRTSLLPVKVERGRKRPPVARCVTRSGCSAEKSRKSFRKAPDAPVRTSSFADP